MPSDATVRNARILGTNTSGQIFEIGLEAVRPSETTVTGSGFHSQFAVLEVSLAPGTPPVYPGERRKILAFKIEVAETAHPYYLLWRCRAARSRPAFGAAVLRQAFGQEWAFQPASIEELAEMGMTVEFGG